MKNEIDDIFEKIINNEIKSFKIYEDDLYIAILDNTPKRIGHTLLIPKTKKRNILYEDNIILETINIRAQKISNILMTKLGATGIKWKLNCEASANQKVFHTHMHLIPYYDNEDNQNINLELEEVYKKLGIITFFEN